MLKKTITYTDYDGNVRTEDFYFNLSKPELIEMQVSSDGGLDKFIKRVVDAQDSKELVALFKEFILKAYGVKSDDGRRFIKSEEIRNSFSQTEAYTELFMELSTSADAAASFLNAVVPSELKLSQEELAKYSQQKH